MHKIVCIISFEELKLDSLNYAIRCIARRYQMGLYMVELNLDLQGHLGSKLSKSAITDSGHIIWPLGALWVYLGWDCIHKVGFDLVLQGHMGSKRFKAAQKWAFSQDNF